MIAQAPAVRQRDRHDVAVTTDARAALPTGSTALGRRRALVATAFFAQGITFATLLTHLPAYTDRWHVHEGAVTLLVLGVSLCAGAGSMVAGWTAAHWGSGRTLAGAVLGIAVGAALTVLVPALATFYLAFLLWGVAVGGVDASMNMQAVDVQARLGRSVLAQFHAAWSLGGIAGALWTSADGRWHLGLTPCVLTVAALVALVAVGLTRLPGRVPADAGAATGVAQPPAAIPWRPMALVGLAVVCFYVVDSGISSWSSLYLRDELHATLTLASVGYAAYQACSLASRALADLAVRRVGAVRVVRTAGVVGTAGLLLVVLAPDVAVAVLGFAVTGLGLAVVAPLSFATTDHLAADVRDATIARLNLSNYLGFVVGGVLVGALGTVGSLRIGYLAPLVLGAGVVLLAPAFSAMRARQAAA
jgi:MFS family permease